MENNTDNWNRINYSSTPNTSQLTIFNFPSSPSPEEINNVFVKNSIEPIENSIVSYSEQLNIDNKEEDTNILNQHIVNSKSNNEVIKNYNLSALSEECRNEFIEQLSSSYSKVNSERMIVSSEDYENVEVPVETDCTDNNKEFVDEDQLLEQKKKRLIEVLKNINIGNPEQANNDNEITSNIENYFLNTSLMELSRVSWTNEKSQNYLRGCKWSPDGTCILTAVNLQGMHLINMPTDLYYNENISKIRPVDCLTTAVSVKENGLVYDYCWFPYMNSSQPDTCFWISSIQHSPIQLWNAFDGSLVSSYRGYNAVDEVESAISLVFSTNGANIYGGYKNNIKIFDIERPGRDYTPFKIGQPASCLAISPDNNVLAVGSWNRTITLFSNNDSESTHTLNGHKGGVTHLSFARSGTVLFSGSRKDPLLQCWDLRVPSKPLHTLCRSVDTNQRIYFDLSPTDRWLISGGTKGTMRVWDTNSLDNEVYELNFPVHNDCCNGVSFHPCRPIIATSSGQHHFENIDNEDLKIRENSLNFWWIGNIVN